MTQQTQHNGVQLVLVSESKLDSMGEMEKIRYVLDLIKDESVLVLESGLTPEEEGKLVERTMHEINDSFTGIEIESYEQESSGGLLSRFMDNTTEDRLTVVGPANKMETLEKDESLIQTVVT